MVAAGMLASTIDGLAPSPEHVAFCEGGAVDTRNQERRIEFKNVVRRAYEERVDLGARGFYATPGVDFNRETGRGKPVPVLHQRGRSRRGPGRPADGLGGW